MATLDTFIEPIVIMITPTKYLVGIGMMACFQKDSLHFHFALN